MTALDWSIIGTLAAFLILTVMLSRSGMQSVADFLAAGRTGGRYLLAVATGVAAVGAITIVGGFEMTLQSGFTLQWWELTMSVVILLAAVYGWVIYRFRQTRCLTLAQFLEVRYSRRFRIFTGLVAFLSGIINMGIFPAVEARFFLHFCGLPSTFAVAGIEVSTFACLMLLLIGTALWFVFVGGQVTVIVTDFLQGLFVNAAMLAVVLYFAFTLDWKWIEEALSGAPPDASLVNPFRTGGTRDFNLVYFVIGVVGYLYGMMSWQGTQGYNASARTAHEAKMAGVLRNWRIGPQILLIVFVPIAAYTVLHHPHFTESASRIGAGLSGVSSDALRSQLTVPLMLRETLPPGLLGLFAALMLCASITTLNTYMHSWGSILVQDVLLPLRKRPFEMKEHLRALRLAIGFVAVFIFAFSLIFQQTQYIYLFFALTGAIFAGGSGAVIIGGLYWKRGTTAAAWTAMLAGSGVAVLGVIVHQISPGFPINGQQFWLLAMTAATLSFVVVSLFSRQPDFDLDRLLRRGRYAVAEDAVVGQVVPERGWRLLGITPEFSRSDRWIYVASYAWTLGWCLVFVVGTIRNLMHPGGNAGWMRFWSIWLVAQLAAAVVTFFWFTIGGMRDLRFMLTSLRTGRRDHTDDGFVARREEH